MPGWELIGKEEQDSLISIFSESNGVMFAHGFDHLRNGRYRVREFENELKEFVSVDHCLATTSGTMAQYIAMKAMGIGPGDEVITQAFTFVATVETIIAIGATPVIVDVNDSYNMDPALLKNAINENTKLIIPVHMLGNPCDMDAIMDIAHTHNLPVMEDGCEAFGAEFKNKKIGSLADVSVFSFDFAKTITTGEGGCIFTNDKYLDKAMREFHDHGHESNKLLPRGRDTKSFPGLNLRMSEIQAAVGQAQLKKIDHIVGNNRRNKLILKNLISKANIPSLQFRRITDNQELADTLIFNFDDIEKTKEVVMKMTEHGIGTKNLPDAMDWHFAGKWNHMFNEVDGYRTTWPVEWKRTADLLERSISIPILCKSTEAEMQDIAKNLIRQLK
mgnify:CR=1 FL=1